MELNMPIKAVKQKPIANIDFMRTYIYKDTKVKYWIFDEVFLPPV